MVLCAPLQTALPSALVLQALASSPLRTGPVGPFSVPSIEEAHTHSGTNPQWVCKCLDTSERILLPLGCSLPPRARLPGSVPGGAGACDTRWTGSSRVWSWRPVGLMRPAGAQISLYLGPQKASKWRGPCLPVPRPHNWLIPSSGSFCKLVAGGYTLRTCT